MGDRLSLYEVPYSDSGSLSSGRLEYPARNGGLVLRFEYERDGKWYDGELFFERARAFRFIAEAHATAWHSENAYDTLVEVRDSPWTSEIRGHTSSATHQWTLRHFLIYLSSAGAYEIIGESWSASEAEQLVPQRAS